MVLFGHWLWNGWVQLELEGVSGLHNNPSNQFNIAHFPFSRLKDFVFPPVDADAGQSAPGGTSEKLKPETEEETDTEGETDSEADDLEAAQPKKKFRKDKIGFRDRKVKYFCFGFVNC